MSCIAFLDRFVWYADNETLALIQVDTKMF